MRPILLLLLALTLTFTSCHFYKVFIPKDKNDNIRFRINSTHQSRLTCDIDLVLHNPTNLDIDVSGWFIAFETKKGYLKKFKIDSTVVITPGTNVSFEFTKLRRYNENPYKCPRRVYLFDKSEEVIDKFRWS